ncbi:beta-lactamase class A [Nonomuraea thailandensis]|uniref:Beta-lactamase class A n=1 Tax=Nonomuraea thailandensis TaxID=1188745 RepID=A0A9X2JYU1_9ACTN|nr:serine hydrolase [Nonomuraea thailandensis]MCP2354203.1 beta-lactamase class A [Nonomuraea thailandensis]
MPLALLASSGVPHTLPAAATLPLSPVAITSAPEPAKQPAPKQPASRRPSYRKGLTRSLDRYLDDLPGDLAVSVRELSSGLTYSYNRRLRTATASIVKVNIVVALLLRAQREHRRLTGWEKRAAAQAIKVSDNDAASRLWAAIGGASGLAAANKKLGLRDTRPGPGGAWGSTTTSAADQVRLLNALVSSSSPLSPRHRRHVLELMGHVAPEQAWGVSAAGSGAQVKNGWLPRERDAGRWTVNSIGRVRERGRTYLIAVISRRHRSLGAGIKAVEHVSKLVAKVIGRAAKN